MLQEFKTFISRGNMIDLAVGVMIGTAFTAIVNSLVTDIVMPPIGVVLGGIDFSNIFVTLSKGASYATLDDAKKAGAATWNIGLFLNAVIRFLLVSWAVFILVKQLNRFYRRKENAPEPTAQEKLLMEIRDVLKARG